MSNGGPKEIRVGIMGANPDRGWAAQAHIPALTSLSDDFEITALSTSRRESADAASEPFGVPAALDNVTREWTPGRITVVLCDEALEF
jgi:predicted dehydrogenase